jgi:predicted aspartyl protease
MDGFPLNTYIHVSSSGKSVHSFNLATQLQQDVRKIQTVSLLDSGAYSCFINHKFVKQFNLETRSLGREIRVFNADATENKKGVINQYVRCQITIGDHTHWQPFLVTDIGRQNIILGMSFLRRHNPEIDWKNGQLEFT